MAEEGVRAALRTAAIQSPSRLTSGVPTLYTPGKTGCSRPRWSRYVIARGDMPNASSCPRVTIPCCL
ncbi:MAG TPA: hypothetical protein VF517_06175 [Thermoleophilaceae bacterium]